MTKEAEAIRQAALSFPETTQGSSCVNMAFAAGKRNFLFLGVKADSYNVRFKLTESLAEARALAVEIEGLTVGDLGWVHLVLPADEPPPDVLHERWIEEAYRAMALKRMLKALDARSDS